MNTEKFNEVIKDRLKLCTDVLCNKAVEYATEDRLHNFKVAAEIQGCTPEKALAGMMCKHTVSVYDLINDLEKGKCATKEMWDEKIGDSLNYLLLLTALLHERLEVPKLDYVDFSSIKDLDAVLTPDLLPRRRERTYVTAKVKGDKQ